MLSEIVKHCTGSCEDCPVGMVCEVARRSVKKIENNEKKC